MIAMNEAVPLLTSWTLIVVTITSKSDGHTDNHLGLMLLGGDHGVV
jgi:hypothetical protein